MPESASVALLPAILLVSSFVVFSVVARAKALSCGCFGKLSGQPVGLVDIGRNVALAVPTSVIAVLSALHGFAGPVYDRATALSAAAVVVGFFALTVAATELAQRRQPVAAPPASRPDEQGPTAESPSPVSRRDFLRLSSLAMAAGGSVAMLGWKPKAAFASTVNDDNCPGPVPFGGDENINVLSPATATGHLDEVRRRLDFTDLVRATQRAVVGLQIGWRTPRSFVLRSTTTFGQALELVILTLPIINSKPGNCLIWLISARRNGELVNNPGIGGSWLSQQNTYLTTIQNVITQQPASILLDQYPCVAQSEESISIPFITAPNITQTSCCTDCLGVFGAICVATAVATIGLCEFDPAGCIFDLADAASACSTNCASCCPDCSGTPVETYTCWSLYYGNCGGCQPCACGMGYPGGDCCGSNCFAPGYESCAYCAGQCGCAPFACG